MVGSTTGDVVVNAWQRENVGRRELHQRRNDAMSMTGSRMSESEAVWARSMTGSRMSEPEAVEVVTLALRRPTL